MINGEMFIGSRAVKGSVGELRGTNAETGEQLEPGFGGATPEQLDEACRLAWDVFDTYREADPEVRAKLLES
ncbi:MAG: aldehyde dehydrogenase (NADP(+)), partial [Sphingomicrobium sp.]